MERFDFLLNKNGKLIEFDTGNDSTIFNMYMNPNKNITYLENNITNHPKYKDSYSDTIDVVGFSLINMIEDMLPDFVSDMIVLHRNTIKDIIDYGLPKIEECGYIKLKHYRETIMKGKTPREWVQNVGYGIIKINKNDINSYLENYDEEYMDKIYVWDCWDISDKIKETLENVRKYMIDNNYDFYIYTFVY